MTTEIKDYENLSADELRYALVQRDEQCRNLEAQCSNAGEYSAHLLEENTKLKQQLAVLDAKLLKEQELCVARDFEIHRLTQQLDGSQSIIEGFDMRACDVHLTTMDLEKERDELRKQLAQAQAEIKDSDWLGKANGWLSPDEAKALQKKAQILDAAITELQGRLGNDDPEHVVTACIEYAATEDELPDTFDSEDYYLSKAVKSLVAQSDEAKRLEAEAACMRCAFAQKEAWPLLETLRSAYKWLGHLAEVHDCDHHGWENYQQCKTSIGLLIPRIEKALSTTAGKDLLSKLERYEKALNQIHNYPVHSEPVGGAYAMQDIAYETLKEQSNA